MERRHLDTADAQPLLALLESGKPLGARHVNPLKKSFKLFRDARGTAGVLPSLPPALLRAVSCGLQRLPDKALGWRGERVDRALLVFDGTKRGALATTLNLLNLLLAAATVKRLEAHSADAALCCSQLTRSLLTAEAALCGATPQQTVELAEPPEEVKAAMQRVLAAPGVRAAPRPDGSRPPPAPLPPPASRAHSLSQELHAWHAALESSLAASSERDEAAMEGVARALIAAHAGSRLRLFGSRASGLQLPGADADFLLCLPARPGPEEEELGEEAVRATCVDALRLCQRSLRLSRGLVDQRSMLLLPRARIPLLKFATRQGMLCDVCCAPAQAGGDARAEALGPAAAQWTRERCDAMPRLRRLLLPLKALLRGAALSDASTGGLGGHATALLAIAYLRQLGESGEGMGEGELLLGCLAFFGAQFDFQAHCVAADGQIVPLRQSSGWAKAAPGGQAGPRVRIQDPLRPEFDVGAPVHNLQACLDLFLHTHSALLSERVPLRRLLPLEVEPAGAARGGPAQPREGRRAGGGAPPRRWDRRGGQGS